MRLRAIILVTLASCSIRPYDTFDTGYDVHFVLYVDGKAVKVEPVCTVGPAVGRSGSAQLAPAAEVAVVNVPRGKYRISVWDPLTKSGGRVTHAVDQDLWILHRVVPGKAKGKLLVFNKPPQGRIPQGWPSLVDVPR
ncbi:MAG: hypothetical protein ACYTGN_05305 [Planctomycetota bacterium]|jgi:hypothetical protein